MYLDTKVNGERRLLNMALQKHLRIEGRTLQNCTKQKPFIYI